MDTEQHTEAMITTIILSDDTLKENIEEIGVVCDLKLVQWDWISETEGTVIKDFTTIGFMADEVKDKYPQHVYDMEGFLIIDYPGLMNELDSKTIVH